MKQIKTEPTKTVLTICVGFIVIYLVTQGIWAIWVALVIGIIGMFSTSLSKKIDFLWMKLAQLLSMIVPNILLSAIFFLILTPVAFFSKVFGAKDPLILKNRKASTFRDHTRKFDKAYFEKPW